jgi:hypothetical protein
MDGFNVSGRERKKMRGGGWSEGTSALSSSERTRRTGIGITQGRGGVLFYKETSILKATKPRSRTPRILPGCFTSGEVAAECWTVLTTRTVRLVSQSFSYFY